MANPRPNMSGLRPIQPGEARNPKGYSRKRRITDALIALIDEQGSATEVAEIWLKAIKAGDFRYFKEFLDRTEGKVPDRVIDDSKPSGIQLIRDALAGKEEAKPRKAGRGARGADRG